MDLVRWHPFGEVERWRNTVDRLLADPLLGITNLANVNLRFPLEVLERDGEVVVRAELAGIDPQDVDVRISDDGITVRGERHNEADQDRDGVRHSERFYGSFARTVAFPVSVDAGQARASFKNGLLEIRAPKRRPNEGRDGRKLDIEVH